MTVHEPAAGADGRRPWRNASVAAGLIAWFGAALYVAASLSVTHLATYEQPSQLAELAAFGEARRRRPGSLLVLHFIAEQCSCTNGLYRALTSRTVAPGVEEHVLFINPASSRIAPAQAAGFAFAAVEEATVLEVLGLTAAPVMVALDRAGHVVYAGGYFDHPSAAVSLDQRLIGSLRQGERPAPLPLFGCALDATLRRQVDPLGLTT